LDNINSQKSLRFEKNSVTESNLAKEKKLVDTGQMRAAT
jgi:hypothetical protein